MISAEELVRRARMRSKPHRQPHVGAYCRQCYLAELEEAIAKKHLQMRRGDVFELVQESLRLEDDLAN